MKNMQYYMTTHIRLTIILDGESLIMIDLGYPRLLE